MGRRRTRIVQDELGPVLPSTRNRRRDRDRGGRVGAWPVLILLLIAAIVAAGGVVILHGLSGGAKAIDRSPASRVVVFLLDGATPGMLSAVHMPNLRALAREGTTYDSAWVGQMESVAPASAATIGTGSFPRGHGVVGLSWRDASTGQLDEPGTPAQVAVGSLEQVMETHHVQSIAGDLKDQHPAAKVLAVGGSNCASADAAATWLADYILCITKAGNQWVPGSVAGHALPPASATSVAWTVPVASGTALGPSLEGWQLGRQDDAVVRTAVAAMNATDPTVTIISFPELGAVLPFSPGAQRDRVVSTLLQGIDAGIGRVVADLRQRGWLSGTTFVITSGEAVARVDTTIPRATLENSIITSGGEQVYIQGGSAGAVGLQDPLQAQPVALTLESQHLSGVDAIYYRELSNKHWEYVPQYLDPLLPSGVSAAYRYLLSTMASNVAPDVVLVCSPRVAVPPANPGPLPSTGASGGLDWASQQVPLILSGHGILSRGTSHFPARMVDLAPTIESLLGLSPVPVDGVVLADSLTAAAGADASRQQDLARTLNPLAAALKQRKQRTGG